MLSKGTDGAKDEPPQMGVFIAAETPVEGPRLRYQKSGEETRLFWADFLGRSISSQSDLGFR